MPPRTRQRFSLTCDPPSKAKGGRTPLAAVRAQAKVDAAAGASRGEAAAVCRDRRGVGRVPRRPAHLRPGRAGDGLAGWGESGPGPVLPEMVYLLSCETCRRVRLYPSWERQAACRGCSKSFKEAEARGTFMQQERLPWALASARRRAGTESHQPERT
jgi:hypothetical protein